MNHKIIAVVVTYNRLSLLKECIRGIRNQTIKLHKIIVVNNGSTDDTELWLNEQSDLLVYNQDNLGASGGFNSGLKEAHKDESAEWFWLMDDDVEALPNCLEELVKYSNISECVHPVRKYMDGQDTLWEQLWDFKNEERIQLDNISFKGGKEFCFVNVGCFEGMLINRNIIEKIGYPDTRFFIVNDDTVYGYLASLHTNIIYVKNAVLIRKKMSFDEMLSNTYVYYSTRNKHLLLEYIKLYFPDVNFKYIQLKYLYQEIKLLIFLILTNKYMLNEKLSLINSLIKGKIDFLYKRTGIRV